MKVLLMCLLSMSCVLASVDDEINEYIKKIDQSQKKVASLLVLQNFSEFFIDSLPYEVVEDNFSYFLSKNYNNGLQSVAHDIFTSTYLSGNSKDKIDSLTKTLIRLRRDKLRWTSLGVGLQKSYMTFYRNFDEGADLCSEKRFLSSLAYLDTYNPTNVDISHLGKRFEIEVGGGLTINEGGEVNFDFYATPSFQGDSDSENIKHAVSTTAGAVAYYLPFPYNIVGAVSIPAVIEAVWGVVDMKKHIKEIEKVAKANEKLHNASGKPTL